MSPIFLIGIGGTTHLVSIGYQNYHSSYDHLVVPFRSMVRLVEPHLDLGIHLLDTLSVVMLMVGRNQDFQQRCHMPVEGMPGAKFNCQKQFGETICYEPTHECTRVGRATLGPECSPCGFQYPLKNQCNSSSWRQRLSIHKK